MKRQLTIIMAVLLTCSTLFALAAVQRLTAVITVTFTVDPAGAGDVLLSGSKKTSTQAFSGMSMTVTAKANPGYEFAGWYIDDELKGTDAAGFTFTTAESNMTVVAKFNELAAEFDKSKRRQLIIDIQQILLNDGAALFLGYPQTNIISSKVLSGVKMYPSDYYWITNLIKAAK